MRDIVNSHHKHKVGLIPEEMGCLAVDIAGYSAVSVLLGVLIINVLGPLF